LRASDAVSSDPHSMLPFAMASRMCVAASPAPPSASASQSCPSAGLRTATGQGNGLAGQHRHAARELRGQVFGRQRQPRQAAGFQRRGEVRDEAEEPPLQVERRREVRPAASTPRQRCSARSA
jgi:hypothetical protein